MNYPVLRRGEAELCSPDPDVERLRRKRDTALGYRLLASHRWGDVGDGHISARDPERTDCFWLLKYGVSFDQATVRDLVLVGPDGTVVEGVGDINQAAHSIHHPVHAARADVVAATHTHTQWGTPFSAERRLIEPITQEACFFYEDQALFDDEEVQVLSTDGGHRIALALGDRRVVVLANHGHLCVGASVAESVAAFILYERVAEAALKAPAAKPISSVAARIARDDLVQPGVLSLG